MLVEFDASASQGGNGYLWNFGDGNTSTVGPIVQHLYLTPGLFYVVKLTLTDTCGTTISDTKALSSLGTEANLNEHTIVYPNPVSGNVLFVEGPVEEVERLNIITLQGVLLPTSYRKEESTLIIELQEIPVGTYILEMETSEGVIRKRFIRSAP